jgi:hypothetical protein
MAKQTYQKIEPNTMCRITINAKPRNLEMGKTIKAELWHFTIQHAATMYNTTK